MHQYAVEWYDDEWLLRRAVAVVVVLVADDDYWMMGLVDRVLMRTVWDSL